MLVTNLKSDWGFEYIFVHNFIYIYIYIYIYICVCVCVCVCVHIHIYIYIYIYILVLRVESSPVARETGVQSQVESYQRLQKWYSIRRIKRKEQCALIHFGVVANEKRAFGSPSTNTNLHTHTHTHTHTYIYIYNYIYENYVDIVKVLDIQDRAAF